MALLKSLLTDMERPRQFGGLPGPAKEFSGKVLVATGAKDFIFCNSNCYGVPEGSDAAYVPYPLPSSRLAFSH